MTWSVDVPARARYVLGYARVVDVMRLSFVGVHGGGSAVWGESGGVPGGVLGGPWGFCRGEEDLLGGVL